MFSVKSRSQRPIDSLRLHDRQVLGPCSQALAGSPLDPRNQAMDSFCCTSRAFCLGNSPARARGRHKKSRKAISLGRGRG